jgi:hypothetical protein
MAHASLVPSLGADVHLVLFEVTGAPRTFGTQVQGRRRVGAKSTPLRGLLPGWEREDICFSRNRRSYTRLPSKAISNDLPRL